MVVDSVAALVPKQEIEGEMGDTFVGLQARLMSQALRKLAGTIAKTNCSTRITTAGRCLPETESILSQHRKTPHSVECGVFWSLWPDSNRRPAHYE